MPTPLPDIPDHCQRDSKIESREQSMPAGEALHMELKLSGRFHGGTELRRNQTRRNTNEPLVPPKPKLFLSAYSIGIWRAVLAQ